MFAEDTPLAASAGLREHAVTVMSRIRDAVGSLEDLEALLGCLQGIATADKARGWDPEDYPLLGAALMDSMEAELGGALFNMHVRAAWEALWEVFSGAMKVPGEGRGGLTQHSTGRSKQYLRVVDSVHPSNTSVCTQACPPALECKALISLRVRPRWGMRRSPTTTAGARPSR